MQNEKTARLYLIWAVRYLAEVRRFQSTCRGNSPAGELASAVEDALAALAATNPAYKSALELEEELAKHGFTITPVA